MYKYGFEIPRNYDHTLRIDNKNNTNKCRDVTCLEMSQLEEYKTFHH